MRTLSLVLMWLTCERSLLPAAPPPTAAEVFATLQADVKLQLNEGTQLESLTWQRRILLQHGDEQRELPLNFEPSLLAVSPDEKQLLVADAFAGELALISLPEWKLLDQQTLKGHNIGGICFLANSTCLVTHQVLHADSPTTADNIAAGLVIENVLHEVHIELNQETRSPKISMGLIKELGVPSNGAADPAGIAIDAEDNLWIALAGVDEVLVLSPTWDQRARIAVGDRPLRLRIDGDTVYVFNELDQSLSVIDRHAFHVTETFAPQHLHLGPTERGERLFFAGEVSRFGWYSCHSCHPRGHSNGQLADTFADETAGAPKRVLSLLGTRDNNPWGWNGKMRSLHDQVRQSGVTTMRGGGFTERQVNDMVAYLHTLPPPPPFRPAIDAADRALIERGRQLFTARGCGKCHVPPLTYTSDGTFDVGLSDQFGLNKFNPPSLIGVGYRRHLFHDSRAHNLNAVLTEFGHQLDSELSQDEQTALIRFLQSL